MIVFIGDINSFVSVKEILLDYWFLYVSSHDVLDYQLCEVGKALGCYGVDRGCFVYFCKECDNYVFQSMGCNSRICSCCGKRYADQWSHSLSEAIFSVVHRHFVMSVPRDLWGFLRDWDMLRVYMGAAVECFNDYFSRVLRRDVVVGLIVILHPFGKDMKFAPHLHVLVTEGGFDKGNNFVPLVFVPADGFRRSWQYRILRRLQECGLSNELASLMFRKYPNGFYVWLHLRGRIVNPKVIERYVGRYVRHPAIANSRIVSYDGKWVRFYYVNNEDSRIDVVMGVDEFISSLIQHIPPKNFKMIRYYGAYSRKFKRRYGAKTHSGIRQLNLYHFGLEKIKYCPFCHKELEFVMYLKKPPTETIKEQRELIEWISSTSR